MEDSMDVSHLKITGGDFIQYLMNSLIFPLEDQDHMGEGKNFWCLDWWVIEICKYLFEGEVGYLRFPKARRLECNNNFKKELIVEAVLNKLQALEEMKNLPPDADCIFVSETCRGFDTMLATTVKDWGSIFVSITSEFPEVIKKTKEYLKRFPNVLILNNKSSLTGEVLDGVNYGMKTESFRGEG